MPRVAYFVIVVPRFQDVNQAKTFSNTALVWTGSCTEGPTSQWSYGHKVGVGVHSVCVAT